MAGKKFDIKFRALDGVSKTMSKMSSGFRKLQREVTRTNNKFRKLTTSIRRLGARMKRAGRSMRNFGRDMAIGVTLPLIGAGGGLVRAISSFEDGLLGVRKTADFTKQETAAFGKEIIKLSKIMPVSQESLLEYSEAAAQLGVKGKDNILDFATVMSKLEKSTDIVGAEGAKDIARLLQLTEGGTKNIDRFGAAIVKLGNNFAASEREILSNATEIAKASAVVKLSTPDVLSIATALRIGGNEAEVSGSSILKFFQKMSKSVFKAGKANTVLRKLVGVKTQKDLQKLFKQDPTAFFQKFLKGFAKINKSAKPELIQKQLELFGLTDIRVTKAIGSLTTNYEKFQEALTASRTAFKENKALDKEFTIFAGSISSKIQLMKNELKSLALQFGPEVKEFITDLTTGVKKLADKFKNLTPNQRKLVIQFAAAAAVLGPLIFVIGLLSSGLGSLFTMVANGAVVIAKFGTAIKGILSFLAFTPLGRVIALVAALTGAVIWLWKNWDMVKKKVIEFGKWVAMVVRIAVTHFKAFIPLATGVFTKIANFMSEAITKAFVAMGKVVLKFGDFIVKAVVDSFKRAFKNALKLLGHFIDGAKKFFKELGSVIVDTFRINIKPPTAGEVKQNIRAGGGRMAEFLPQNFNRPTLLNQKAAVPTITPRQETPKAEVTVSFLNTPAGTNIKPKKNDGVLKINRGNTNLAAT